MIRINLSNEECHYAIADSVMSGFVSDAELTVVTERIDELEDKLIEASTWAEI